MRPAIGPDPSSPGAARTAHGDARTAHGDAGRYVRRHLAAATGGLSLARRIAGRYAHTAAGPALADVATAIAQDRAALADIADSMGVRRPRVGQAASWTAEHLSRLAMDGPLVRSAPLTPVLELEALLTGITAKGAGWRNLRAASTELGLDEGRLTELARRADEQLAVVDALRQAAFRSITTR